MDITGFWKVSAVNAFDKNFKQTWKTSDEIAADDSINPMQKAMAQGAYVFAEDGTMISLMPKKFVPAGEGEPYDDTYVIAKKSAWKEEGGKLYSAAEENGELDWQEMKPVDGGYELFGFQRIAKA